MDTIRKLQRLPGEAMFQSLVGCTPTDSFAHDLAADYCQLLIGPQGHLPPYQSVWQYGQLQSNVADSVVLFRGALNLSPEDEPDELLDHIGLELEMMSMIYQRIHRDETWRTELTEFGRRFFASHLSWPQPLFAAMEEQATTAFYRELAQVTQRCLESDSIVWDEILLGGNEPAGDLT